MGTEEAGVGRRDFLWKTLIWRVVSNRPALLEAFGTKPLGSQTSPGSKGILSQG